MTRAEANALVVGLGITGMSAVRYLRRRGYAVSVADSRAHPPNADRLQHDFPEVGLHTGDFATPAWRSADLVVLSPGVSPTDPALPRERNPDAEIVGDVELFAREVTAPVIAITGSNGKSTVTALVGEMCRAGGASVEVAGNIGVPVLDLVSGSAVDPDLYVLELSSFQLETTSSLKPLAATVLNVTRDHMDRYASVADYVAAKRRIYRGCARAIVNRDDPLTRVLVPASREPVTFGAGPPPRDVDYGLLADGDGVWLARGAHRLVNTAALALNGAHNRANVLAAMALCEAAGVRTDAMVDAAIRFRGLPHRSELIAEQDAVSWINDSKATNVGATVAALDGIDAPVILIAGGQGKDADFSALCDPVARRARAVIVYGEDAEVLERTLTGTVPVCQVADLSAAVDRAAELAEPGDCVLLSPACASFDMFRGFAHRGDEFRRLVRERLS